MLIWQRFAATSVRNSCMWACCQSRSHCHTTLPRTLSEAQFIEHIKKHPQNGSKSLALGIAAFSGNGGCGAFSVSPSQLDSVLEYVNKQQEHHRKRTFQE